MAYGICYTQSGSTKKYERDQLEHNYMESSDKHITVYTVGYPSTAYYPDGYNYHFNIFTYPGPGGWPIYPGFTEGTAEYLYYINTDPSTPDENWHDTHSKIYNLMSYTPPNGYVLDENGDYTYTAEAKIYSCNLDVKYGGITNSINGGTDTMHRTFRYSKIIQTTDIRYPVTLSINGSMVHCTCQRVTWIGSDAANFILGVNIGFSGYNGGYSSIDFKWQMKNGIDETKGIGIPDPVYSRSGFTTRNDWQLIDSDGNITNYIFDLQVIR